MLSLHPLRACALWLLSVSLLVAADPTPSPAPQAPPASRQPIRWNSLTYFPVPVPALQGEALELTLSPAGLSLSGLTFNFTLVPGDVDIKAFDEPGRMKVRLHYPDGKVLEPQSTFGPTVIATGPIIHFKTYTFPFSENTLTNAWLEVRIDGNTYWYEIPYGFTLDPSAPLPPSDPKAPPAGYAPAMKDSPKDAQIIRWQSVCYDFGAIQNGWKLQADLTNNGDLGCLLHLKRPDGPWEFHTPITTVKVEPDTGATLEAAPSAERLDPHHPTDREDEFAFRFKRLTGRGWGTLTITVDHQPYTALISLGPFLPGFWHQPWSQ